MCGIVSGRLNKCYHELLAVPLHPVDKPEIQRCPIHQFLRKLSLSTLQVANFRAANSTAVLADPSSLTDYFAQCSKLIWG